MKSALIAMLVVGLAATAIQARGRRPEGEDGYPDYNRLELLKKLPDISADPSAPAPTPAGKPTLNVPLNPTPGEDDKPKPPPAAIPSKDTSEPALPDDLLNTLVPSTATQK